MDLLIVRHAIAVDHADWRGRPDSERPLTDKGRARMKRNADGLAVACPRLDLIATSPFVRAVETAAFLKAVYESAPVEHVAALASGGPRNDVLAWLQPRREDRIAVVGHEPDLGSLAAWLVSGGSMNPLEMRKGGACLLTFSGEVEPGAATLRWFLPPFLLRKLARF